MDLRASAVQRGLLKSEQREDLGPNLHPSPTFPKEVYRFVGHFVCAGPNDAMRSVLHHRHSGTLKQFGGPEPRALIGRIRSRPLE